MPTSFTADISQLTKTHTRLEARKDYIQESIEKEKAKRKTFMRLERNLEKALIVSQEVAQQTQEELEYQVSTLVTNAMESIFPNPYSFHVEFEIKRGKTEAAMFFMQGDEEIDPLTAAGGGVVDVASFALRLSSFLISNEKPPPCILLDEPFRFVSEEYQPAVADLMEEMAEKLGIQFICVTHEVELKVGNVIQL